MSEAEQQCMEIKLSVPWGHVAAKAYGSSTGKPVLIVHGHLDNAGSFTRLMKYLPNELFYYVCIDLPGHGWSSHFPPWMICDFMNYTHALYFILEALKWKTFFYIGHSMGAQIGLMFSILQPNRIKKLISLDGILGNPYVKDFLIKHFTDASAFSIEAYHNKKKPLFTKDEILHAFKTKRFSALNSEAADALFVRAVTKVNEKYKYNRDIQLKNGAFLFKGMNDDEKFTKKLTVPIYLFVSSKGVIFPYKNRKLTVESMKTILKIIYVDGNHDVHNNNPEKIAPFICEILNSDNFSKL